MRGRDVDAIGGLLIDPARHLVCQVMTGADDGQVLLGPSMRHALQLKDAQTFALGGLVLHLRGAAQARRSPGCSGTGLFINSRGHFTVKRRAHN